ncbi:MAG: CotH kinase family protein [Tannerella sp.]|jgi:hypothetical protein|nr:CotH kinase family protein [Tannerella sp.]
MKNHIFTIKLLCFLATIIGSAGSWGQTSRKLIPDGNTVKIIGTRFSVDYLNNNTPSETANAKSNVFDGNLSTFFASYDRSYTWVGLDLGEKHVITKVAYAPRPDWDQRLLLGVLEGANHPDFGDAIPLCIISVKPPSGQLTQQEVNNSRGFRYVRYVGPSDVRCNIAELEFYGYESEGNDSRLHTITNIPDVIIHTENAEEITSKEQYIKGIISFISDNGATVYTDSLEIRGRGNASWGFDKKPYRIKLYNKKSIFPAHPAEGKNWTLISNHGDKTLMRNLLAFDIGKRLRMPYTPAGRPVNVFLNGEYKGCYQFCDHIDVRENRVDIKEMKSTDISGNNLTGGYLVEIDAYATSEKEWFTSLWGIPVVIKSPDDDVIVRQQREYIKTCFNNMETAIYSSSYTHPTLGFRKCVDTETLLKHFLVGELSGNTDTYWSVYMYKQRNDDKFYFGPVWDFDLAFENDNRTYPLNEKGDWIYKFGSAAGNTATMINRLLSDANLQAELRAMWSNFRDWGMITAEELLKTVDDYALEIYDSQELNFIRWDIRNKYVHQMWGRSENYEGDVAIVKNYIRQRIAWIDNKLNYIPNPDNTNPYGNANHSNVWDITANVWAQNRIIRVDGVREAVRIEIVNIAGQTVYKREINEDTSFSVSSSGMYIVCLSNSNGKSKRFKIIIS